MRSGKTTPAIIILGTDAVLAVRPATYGQLANACYAAGYNVVIPGSWGDELVAAGCLREIAARGRGTAVLCSCPRVAEPMRRAGSLTSYLLPMVPPPVAAARYLRARAGVTGVHITYVGECPGASDPSIDRHATPASLLRGLAKRGIDPARQPVEIEERLVRDARRFYSLPGGAPAPNWLYAEKRGYTLLEPTARDYLAEIAHLVADKERRVIDLAPRLGCACSGAVVGEAWQEAREAVAGVEPPRAVHEVLDHDVPLSLATALEPWTGSAEGGQRTMAIPLGELAAMYDPSAKAAPIRASAPRVVKRRSRPAQRPSGEANAADPGMPRPGPASGRDDRASGRGPRIVGRPSGPASVTQPLAEDAAAAPAGPSDDVRTPASVALTGSSSPPAAALDAPETASRGEPQTGHRRPPDSRPPRRRRIAIIVGAVTAAACAILAVRAHSVSVPRPGPRSSARSALAISGPGPTSSVGARSDSVATPTSRADEASRPQMTDSSGATAIVEAPTPRRLPVGPMPPASGAATYARARPPGARVRSEDTTLFSPRFRPNPAPVFTPGAVPMPRTDTPATALVRPVDAPLGPASPAAVQSAGAAFRDALSPEAAAEMAAVRAAVVRRQRATDSSRGAH